MRLHPSITAERIVAAVQEAMFGLDNPGFCVACGADQDGCEPDARNYDCENCGEPEVFGAEELLFHLPATVARDEAADDYSYNFAHSNDVY